MITRRAVLRGVAGGITLGALLHGGARADTSPSTATIEAFYDVLLQTMKEGIKLGFNGRYQKLDPAMRRAFNLPLMTRLAIGPQWTSLPQDQQVKLTDAFSRFSIATYASRFDDYSGERFEVDPAVAHAAMGEVVNTKLILGDGDPITLNYLMRRNDAGPWQIIDVFLSGTVSELSTRRAEFSSVLRRDGANALVALLRRKSEEQIDP